MACQPAPNASGPLSKPPSRLPASSCRTTATAMLAMPAPGRKETHYSVQVVSPAFAGQSRLTRSRAVHAVLAAEFGGGLHALSLRLLTPEEAGRVAAASPRL
ncbi:BolA family protein [Siccirubricoccus deserti]